MEKAEEMKIEQNKREKEYTYWANNREQLRWNLTPYQLYKNFSGIDADCPNLFVNPQKEKLK